MKNKVSISMVSLFCLMLAGGAYEAQACIGAECPEGTGQTDTNTGGSNTNTTGGSNKSIAEGGYWSQVDALTANDKLMEIAYNDTLSDGKAKARDKALSALNKALESQRKLDEEVKARSEAIDKDKLTPRQKYENGMMTDDELTDYAATNSGLARACKDNGWCTAEEYIAGYNKMAETTNLNPLRKETEERIRKYYDPELVEELKNDEDHLFHGDPDNSTEENGWLQSAVDEYTEKHGSEAERQQREQDFWDKMKADATEDAKKENASDIYNANKAMAEAMTPEMKETIRGELGVGDGAAINQALKDPKAKQDLQNRLDKMASTYSDFPKVDLDTQEGQSLLHSMVGTTNAGDLGTVSKSEATPLVRIDPKPEEIIVKTSDEKLQDDMQDLLDSMATDPIYNPVGSYMDKINNPDKYDPLGLGQDFDYGALGDNNTTGGLGNDTTVE